MGMRVPYIKFLQKSLEKAGFSLPEKKNIIELGNQHLRYDNPLMVPFLAEHGIKDKPRASKQFFSRIGYNHVSIDTNGQDGALKENLSKPIKNKDLVGKFDVLTNYGTSEHVGNQYECFNNIHNLCAEESVMAHIVPHVGHWPGHCPIRYTPEFFEELGKACGYTILYSETQGNPKGKCLNVCTSWKKEKDSKFVSKEKFEEIIKLHTK